MIQKLVVGFLVLAGLIAATAAVVIAIGPRMRWQASLRSFEAPVTPMPTGVVQMPSPFGPGPAGKAYPPQPAANGVETGSTYYAYYCTYCHGESGDGNGPVGQSYVPKPTDLRTAEVRQLSDEELLRAMLFGTGHEPVLNRIVPEEHQGPLLAYVRSLASGAPPLSAGNAGTAAPK